jgi:hypothetical protein
MSNIIYFTPLKSVFLGKPYYTIMALNFSISSLVSTFDPYQPSSFAVRLDMGVSG